MLKKEEIFVNIRSKKECDKVIKLLKSFGQECRIKGWDRYERCAHFYENRWCVPVRSYIEKFKTEVSLQELKNILAFEYLKKGDVIIFSGGTVKMLWIAEFDQFVPNRGIGLPLSIKSSRYNSLCRNSRYCNNSNGEIDGSFVRFATESEKRILGVKQDPNEIDIKMNKLVSDSMTSELVNHINKIENDIRKIPAIIKSAMHPRIGCGPMYYSGEKIENGSVIYINDKGNPELYQNKDDFHNIHYYGNFKNEIQINEEWPMKPQVSEKDQLIESLNDAYKSISNVNTLDAMPVRSAISRVMDYMTSIPEITTYDVANIERLHDYLIDNIGWTKDSPLLIEAREVILKLDKYTNHE